MKTKKEKFDYRTIKTFEDACRKVGVDPQSLPEVSMLPEEFRASIISMYKLYIIYKAINDGWVADYSNARQLKYYPWFRVGSSGSGFDLSYSDYNCDITGTYVGSRLCTDSSEKARYIAEQFKDQYEAIFLISK